jgi:two-component system response regulator DevR
MTIRVFLLDDQEVVREGLKVVLGRERDLEVVGEASSKEAGLPEIALLRPDVVLVDLMDSSSAGGLEACRAIRRDLPEVACVVLTWRPSDEILMAAVRADVAGLLVKDTSAEDLVRGVREIAQGATLIDPTLTGRLLERLRQGRSLDHQPAALADLSPQERRLLDHLGEGLPNREIAQRMELAEKTVKNYVSSLLGKLGMRSRTEAAVFVTNLKVTAGQG